MSDSEQQVADVQSAIDEHLDREQLSLLFDAALNAKNWIAVKIICDMDTPNKPLEADKESILKQAIAQEQWQDVFDIEKTFKKEDYTITQGPLPKSIYTVQLEKLTRDLLKTDDFKVNLENDDYIFTFKNGNEYNWTEIRNYANFQHVTLTEQDFDLFKDFVKVCNRLYRPDLEYFKKEEYKRALYGEYYQQNKELPTPSINFQEMQAINVYTGGFYTEINALLRGTFSDIDSKLKTTRAALITSVFCASGLQKIPETSIIETYRGAKYGSTNEQIERVTAAAQGGTVRLEGFVSSSIDAIESDFQIKPVFYHFKNIRGMYVAPISKLPKEREFLIPPHASKTQ